MSGSPFLFVYGDDRVTRYTGVDDDTGDAEDAQNTCEKPCYKPHSVMPGGVPRVRNTPRLPNSLTRCQEGQSIWIRRTSHNSHTYTGKTRQPKPQLKGSSCSSTIPSHNLRDVILSHNSRNATCLTPIPSHNSKDTFRAITQETSSKPTFKVSPKHCRSRTTKANKALTFVIAWRQATFR
ncbi:hypothetical protein DEO72_LG5g2643 [Vigna unguiculata]|uniref:Uncharacterized protein n=1 Tax=Vigna unguiculata TaxID=3917 RepID=A0A4D6LZX4_VIGUN|nr:hypothetical protein DEO72_LG5g2643 [Vigna unguiculata]